MVVDSEWDESDYHYPSKARLRREKEIYDQIEMGGYDDESDF
jgi:hypothetical protein